MKKKNRGNNLCLYVFLMSVFVLVFLLAWTYLSPNSHKQNNTNATAVAAKDNTDTTNEVPESTLTPPPKTTLSPEQRLEKQVETQLRKMSLEEKVAQLFMITPEALTGYQTVTSAGPATKQALAKYPVGGLIYFAQNIQNPAQLTKLTSHTQSYAQQQTGLPLFLGIDEEGGAVARIAKNPAFSTKTYENMWTIGATGNSRNAYKVGTTIGSYLHKYGFNLDFAPDADVLTNPDNQVIGTRSFGSDPKLVANMVVQEMKGLEKKQIYACLKHFPGHGGTQGDTHKGYAYTNRTLKQLKKSELIPFQRGIQQSVSFIMVSHISLPKVTTKDEPASVSKEIITNLLRNQMGYDGIVITDAMNMGAITSEYNSANATVKALKAGADIILMPQDFKSAYNGVLSAVRNKELSKKRINQSVRRILRVKLTMQQ